MQPSKPGVTTDNLLQHVSVAKVLSGNVSLGSALKYDANKVPTIFAQDNGDGQLIRHVFTANLANSIPHDLNRIPIGYFITRSNAPVVLYDPMDNAGWTEKNVNLFANANADVTFYLF